MASSRQPEPRAAHDLGERVLRPDLVGRVVLAAVAVVAAIGVALVPVIVLSVLHRAGIALLVLLVVIVFALWRSARVSITADAAGITVRGIWITETLRWKRVERIVEDRRAWLPGLVVPTLRLRGDADLVPLLGAVAAPDEAATAILRQLHGRVVNGDWRTEGITAPRYDLGGPNRPEAPAVG